MNVEAFMKRLLVTAALAVLLIGSALAIDGSRMTCTMTGETVEKCCCTIVNGAMVCSMTGETVATCCCVESS
jgi:hypothetical protein